MYKKIFSAIMLAFAFLFLSLSNSDLKVNAAENIIDGIPEDVYKNAGFGYKKGYWAVVNYGDTYVGSTDIVIDIQREAIADEEVHFIMIAETEYASSGVVYYEKNVDVGFSSRINYTLKNKECGYKSVAILLLREFTRDPMNDNAIVDKIIVGINHKETICGLEDDEVIVTQKLLANNSYATINVTLKNPQNYVLKNVKYRNKSSEETYLNAMENGLNSYSFNVYQNVIYEIVLEDVFGCSKIIEFEASGIEPLPIIIEAIPRITTPTNKEYFGVDIKVYSIEFEKKVLLTSSQIDELVYSFEGGEKVSIKEQMVMYVYENGNYLVQANVKGRTAILVVVIKNIDREAPFVTALEHMEVYTESLPLFNPKNEIFFYDNVSSGEYLEKNIQIKYYATRLNGEEIVRDSELSESNYKQYLKTVRDIVIVYTVTDEAGNTNTMQTYVKSIDDTKPTISYSAGRMLLYINDPYPTARQLEVSYGIVVRDNSIYDENCGRTISYTLDYSDLPVIEDAEGVKRLSELGLFRIFVRAVDESGNESDMITLNAEIRERVIKIEAKPNQYSIYGEFSASNLVLEYHCLVRQFDVDTGELIIDPDTGLPIYERKDCKTQLLEGDSLIGELYIEEARYVGQYKINYDRMMVPSKLYYLEYGEEVFYEIRPRIIRVVATDKEKLYLDLDPQLEYTRDDSVCEDSEKYKEGYRCGDSALLPGDTLKGKILRYLGSAPEGVITYGGGINTAVEEYVWFDLNGNVLSRPIIKGSLYVDEVDNGGVNNYIIDFVEGKFFIYPKYVDVTINNKEKIYGEEDPFYDIGECTAYVYIEGVIREVEDCTNEFGITLKRTVEGENVVKDSKHYKIEGDWANKNYIVNFTTGYLRIIPRYINIKVEGDLDKEGNYTGKYTIIYEDEMPDVKVYDNTSGKSKQGLVDNESLNIKDSFKYGKADIYNSVNNELVIGYVNGVGIYRISQGTIGIVDKDGNDVNGNYDIDFDEGTLEVIKREIWIKILEKLSKVYGEDDLIFDMRYVEAKYEDQTHVIIEAKGRYVIEIANEVTLTNGEPYIPRDNKKMKYHINREEGINVGVYKIFIEKLENCENYDVFLVEDYIYTISTRDMDIEIYDEEIIYRNEDLAPFDYNKEKAETSLQYEDYLIGNPKLKNNEACYIGMLPDGSNLKYCNVGEYLIGLGTIKILNNFGEDVSFNYKLNITDGILTILQREIVVVAEKTEKLYGNDDPVINFFVFHNGVKENLPHDQYEGMLDRAKVDENGREAEYPRTDPYEINQGTLKIKNFGENGEIIENYLIIEWDLTAGFYINKRKIIIASYAPEDGVMYGENYNNHISYNTLAPGSDGLANNTKIKIDGVIAQDEFVGELVIKGAPITGVGDYELDCTNFRIVRYVDKKDVTEEFYEVTYNNAILKVTAREIFIHVKDGQFKKYGENDPEIEFTKPELLDETDVWVGSLKRRPVLVNGSYVLEDAGYSYPIYLGEPENGGLYIKTASGKENYKIFIDSNPTFEILHRSLFINVKDVTITYVDNPYSELEYTIEGDGLAKNESLGINDKITGSLYLNPEYVGCGVYAIAGNNAGCGNYEIKSDKLVISNARNYSITFKDGILIVNKRVVVVTPVEETLYKTYGEEDPVMKYTIDFNIDVEPKGKLTRELGENARKYMIYHNELDFGANYEIRFPEGKQYYFTILQREIDVVAKNSGKIYNHEDPVLEYYYVGTLVGSDSFSGKLERDSGEAVGEYKIKQGDLNLPNGNYKIKFTEGIFTIRYIDITELTIVSRTNNQYQSIGQALSTVELYAKFNKGADESDIANVKWSVVKKLSNGTESDWTFTKPANENLVHFTPSGSVGTYIVTASYGGLTAHYEVYVSDASGVGIVHIWYVSGETTQIRGNHSEIVYRYGVTGTTEKVQVVQWLINGVIVQTNSVDQEYFFFTPTEDMIPGEYKVQALIVDRYSEETFSFYIENNNAPKITLNGESVVYIEAKTGAVYIDKGATAIDDIDGEVPVIVSGSVNTDIKGTYYIRYDAVDRHGNHAITTYRHVIVRDTTPPVVTLNGNKEVVLLFGQEYIDPGATAYDNYDGVLEVTRTNPVVTNRIGTYEVLYTAYDESGNRGSATRYVTVIDNISPIITLIGDEIMYVEVHTKFEDPGARIVDNVDGSFVLPATSFLCDGVQVDKIDTSKISTCQVRYDYKDTAGNVGAGKVRTVIIRDTTAPVITLNGLNPTIVRYSYPNSNYKELGAVAKDNYDKFVEVTITGRVGVELGAYILEYNAIDSNGNKATTVTRDVVVVDVENPVIHFINTDKCPQYMTLEAMRDKYPKECDKTGFGVIAEDNHDIDLIVTVKGSVDDQLVGEYIINYSVSDSSGNIAVELNRYVSVVDTTPPVITLNGDKNVITEVFEEYVDLGATVYDTYDSHERHNKEIKIDIVENVNINKLGFYEVFFSAVDSNGNRAETVIRIVEVKDTKPPVITILGPNPLIIERGTPYVEYEATVIDNYDGPMNNYSITGAPSGMILNKYEVVYKAIDSSGNIGQAIRIVEVVDTIPPTVLGVEDGVYYRTPVSIHFIPTIGTNEVLTGWLNGEVITNPWYVDKEGEYNLLVKDDAGNKTEIWFAIDITPPEILGVRDGEYTNREEVVITTNEKIRYFEYRYQTGDWIRAEKQQISFKAEGTYRIYAVDMAGNVSGEVTFIIDKTPPIYSLMGVINKGITSTDVTLVSEEGTSVVVNAMYTVEHTHVFIQNGYYQVTIRDLAGNTVNLQFVINKSKKVAVNDKVISILDQYNAINKVSIMGTNYHRNSGYMIVKPLLEGGFEYISGKLFSEAEYQKLIAGETIEFGVSQTDDTYMFAAFVVDAEELNKFGTQTVDGEDEEDNKGLYIFLIFLVLFLIGGAFWFFLRRRRREEEEQEDDEIIIDDY